MAFYYTIVAIASILAGIADSYKCEGKFLFKFFYALSCFVLLLPLAMRGVGVDIGQYIISYTKVKNTQWLLFWSNYNGNPEPLYAILNYCALYFFHSFQGVNILCAVITLYFSFAAIYKFKDIINIGITIYSLCFSCYILMYGLNRMMIAVALVSWSYQYYINKDLKNYTIWNIIAGLFHYSAFIMLPLYFLMHKLDNANDWIKQLRLTRVIIGLFITLFCAYILLPMLFGSMPWFPRYSGYFTPKIAIGALNNNFHTFLGLCLIYICRSRLKEMLGENSGLLSMVMMFVLLSLLSIFYPVQRLCYYFYPCISIIYGAIPKSFTLTRKKLPHLNLNLLIYYSLVVINGFFWIYFFVVVMDLWSPYINPYRIGDF